MADVLTKRKRPHQTNEMTQVTTLKSNTMPTIIDAHAISMQKHERIRKHTFPQHSNKSTRV